VALEDVKGIGEGGRIGGEHTGSCDARGGKPHERGMFGLGRCRQRLVCTLGCTGVVALGPFDAQEGSQRADLDDPGVGVVAQEGQGFLEHGPGLDEITLIPRHEAAGLECGRMAADAEPAGHGVAALDQCCAQGPIGRSGVDRRYPGGRHVRGRL